MIKLPSPNLCECGGRSSVIDVRVRDGKRWGAKAGWLLRRRECLVCGARWSTWESAVIHPLRLRRELESRTDIADPRAVLLALIDPARVRPSRGE